MRTQEETEEITWTCPGRRKPEKTTRSTCLLNSREENLLLVSTALAARLLRGNALLLRIKTKSVTQRNTLTAPQKGSWRKTSARIGSERTSLTVLTAHSLLQKGI